MIGNAVPVQFAYNLAKKIFSDLSKIKGVSEKSYVKQEERKHKVVSELQTV